jgi:hypothetical protein
MPAAGAGGAGGAAVALAVHLVRLVLRWCCVGAALVLRWCCVGAALVRAVRLVFITHLQIFFYHKSEQIKSEQILDFFPDAPPSTMNIYI